MIFNKKIFSTNIRLILFTAFFILFFQSFSLSNFADADKLPQGTSVSTDASHPEIQLNTIFVNPGSQTKSFLSPDRPVSAIFATVTTYVDGAVLYFDSNGISYSISILPNSNTLLTFPQNLDISNVKISITGRGYSDDQANVGYFYAEQEIEQKSDDTSLTDLPLSDISLAEINPGLIKVPQVTQTPTIDGKWSTSSEWKTASKTTLVNIETNDIAYLHTMRDNSRIFIMIDFVSDQTLNENDRGSLAFGNAENRQTIFRINDYWFTTKPAVYQGMNVGGNEFRNAWKEISLSPQIQIVDGFDSLNSPYIKENHRIYEFVIPFSFIGSKTQYSFYVSVQDKDSRIVLRWPSGVEPIQYIDAFGGHHPTYPKDWGVLDLTKEGGELIKTSSESIKMQDDESGGCLIATAAFGSEMAPQVQFLREIRDNTVMSTSSGASFMGAFNAFYYSFSPTVADWERQNPVFKEIVKATITPLITSLAMLQYFDIDTEEEMLGYGIGIILLNVGMYFVAPAIILVKISSRLKK